MRLTSLVAAVPVFVLALAPVSAPAMPKYACAVHEVFECTAVAGCKRIKHATAGIPPMVTLSVSEKGLFSGLFGGGDLLQKGDVYDDEKVLIMRGRKGLQTWSAVVEKPTGAMSGTIAQAGRAFTQFGTCVEAK
ncbi:MAG: hypothetical protein AAGF48_12485 [Pseudomonadota bacterium]